MSYNLNFNTIKKQFMTVTLPDEKQTVLMIGTPTKSLLAELSTLEDQLKNVANGDDVSIESLYDACAKIMSRNKAGTKITRQKLEKCLDIEDITVFFYSYIDFVTTIGNQKN